MSEFGEGVRTGYSTVSQANPFSAYIKRVDEARARQLADQKDVQELKSLFAQLEKKHEYDTQVEEQKRQIGLELEKEKGVQDRMNKLSEGYTFDESGNEIAPAEQTNQAVEQAQPVDRNQRLLQMTGLAMPSKPVNRVGAMAPAPQAKPKSSSTTLPAAFFGKEMKVRKKNDVETQLKQENLKYMQSINKKMSEGGGNDLIYRDRDTGEEVSADIAQREISKGNNNYIVNRKEFSKSGVKETPLMSSGEGKFRQEQDEKKKANEERDSIILDSANDTLNTIKEVEGGMKYFGLTGDVWSIPGTARKNWEVNVNKLLSGKILDVMTKMKEASKTGGTGFGQLSNKELEVLRQASTSLKKSLSKKDAQRYLNDMKSAMKKVVENKSKDSNEFSNMSDEELKAIINGR